MGKSTHLPTSRKMGRLPDDSEAPAADDRRTMLTPTVTEIKRGSAHGRDGRRPSVIGARLAPGDVLLRDATTSFSVRTDQAATLRGRLSGDRREGPAPRRARSVEEFFRGVEEILQASPGEPPVTGPAPITAHRGGDAGGYGRDEVSSQQGS